MRVQPFTMLQYQPRVAKAKRRAAIPYRQAIDWIVRNDDCEWLAREPTLISVTAAFAADIYDRSGEEVVADLRARYKELRG